MQASMLGQRYFGVPSALHQGRRTTDRLHAGSAQSGGHYSSFGTPLAPRSSPPEPGGVVRVLIVDTPGPALDRLMAVVRAYAGFQLLPPVVYGMEYHAELADDVRHQAPDVMFMDVGSGGAETAETVALIRQCRAASPQTEILLRTHVGNDERVLACIEAGASGYFFKDAAAEWIVACVLALRGGGALISPGIARRVLSRFPLCASGEHMSEDGTVLT
jgi:DNA-binding NarL/FixJ family response regulator